RLITLKRVVLPAPLGPMRAHIWPSSTVNDSRLRATTPPKRTLTSSTLSSCSTSGEATSFHEHDPQGVIGLDAAAGAEDDALEGKVDQLDLDLGLEGQPLAQAPQQPPTAD